MGKQIKKQTKKTNNYTCMSTIIKANFTTIYTATSILLC